MSPNAAITPGDGLTLTLSDVNCPVGTFFISFVFWCAYNIIGCGGFSCNGGAWNSVNSYNYGTYTFIAQNSDVAGKK